MIEQLRQALEQSFPGMSHSEIAVFLLLGAALFVFVSSILFARILRARFLENFGMLAFMLLIALALIRMEMR